MGEEIFTFLRESKYSVSLITVPFCQVAPCPFQILTGVLFVIPFFNRMRDVPVTLLSACHVIRYLYDMALDTFDK